jgi:putative transposase
MCRLARIVVPGVPHHVTQRGNRRQQTFFSDADYALYRTLLAEFAAKACVAVWAYCLMPNHVHLILVPTTEHGLAAALGEAHRRYTRHVNFREGWRGFLWQGRFASFPMDEAHLLAAAQHVELNPVRAGLVRSPEDWPWSSARAHLEARGDGLVEVAPLLARAGDWRGVLAQDLAGDYATAFRRAEHTGRPLGSADFVKELEERTGRLLAKRKPGPHGGRAGRGRISRSSGPHSPGTPAGSPEQV